jgi:hypothetical protein
MAPGPEFNFHSTIRFLTIAGLFCIFCRIFSATASADGTAASHPLGKWQELRPMLTVRDTHTATLLADGRILIIGGRDLAPPKEHTLSATEFYLPGKRKFVPGPPLAQDRAYHTATLLRNDNLLICGGFSISRKTLASVECYLPALGQFQPTGEMQVAREMHSATLLADGRVLIVGGLNSDGVVLTTAEIYDPVTGLFCFTDALRYARYGHAAVLLADGNVLICGGRDINSKSVQEAELYDSKAGKFVQIGQMQSDRYRASATLLYDGRILITGGYSSAEARTLKDAEIYDPNTASFTLLGTMCTDRMDHTATLLKDGRVLITGGWSAPTLTAPIASCEIFDPKTETFTPIAPMQTARHEHTATLLENGKILIAGGQGADLAKRDEKGLPQLIQLNSAELLSLEK